MSSDHEQGSGVAAPGEQRSSGPAAAGPAPRGGRWRRWLAIAGGALALLAIGLRVALPYAALRAIPPTAERFGFAASAENVDFSLHQGQLTVEGFRVAPLAGPDPGGELLRLRRLFVDLELGALLGGELRLAEVALEGPALRLSRAADGHLLLPSLPPPAPEEPAAPAPEPTPPSKPWPVHIASLRVRETSFVLADAAGGPDLADFALQDLGLSDLRFEGAKLGLGGIQIAEPRLRVRRDAASTRVGGPAEPAAGAPPETPPAGTATELRIDRIQIERAEFEVLADGEPVRVAMRLDTRDVSLAPNAPFLVDLVFEAEGGSLSLAGQLGLNPLTWDGKLAWKGLRVPLFVRAALPELTPWIRSCSASGDLDVKLRLTAGGGAEPGLELRGQVGVQDFSVEDPKQELALGWKQLAIDIGEARVPLGEAAGPPTVALTRISLLEPAATWVQPNTALARLQQSAGGEPARGGAAPPAPPEPAAQSPPAAGAAPEPRISIGSVELRGGRGSFTDRSGRETYRGELRNLELDASEIHLPERTLGSLKLRGQLADRSTFELRSRLPGEKGDLALKLDHLPLAPFSAYSSPAADLRIRKGDLSFDLKAALSRQGAAGKVDTAFVLHQLEVQGGPKAVQVAGLPLDLALALLRDPKGDIQLAVPLQYGEQGSSVDVATVVTSALRAAITGAVSSPLKLVGAALPTGGGALSFEPLAFAPGSAELAPDAASRLAPLADLLRERPGLALAIAGRAGPADTAPLALAILGERAAAGQPLPEVEAAGFFARRRIQAVFAARGRGEDAAFGADDEALVAQYAAATPVPPERLRALAEQRARALRDALASAQGLDAAQIRAEAAPEAGAPEAVLELRPR